MIEAIELTSTRRPRHADGGPVEKVSFDVYPGQVTALLGASGAGKSTILRLMAELEPGAGRTLFGGRPYRALRPAVREVGLALNPDAVHPGRTVQAHLQLYAAAGGVPKPRVAEVLEISGLSTQATVRCGRLDSGQRQRLSIAAALIGDPAALILDEPLALDTHGMSWFHALIRAYAAQGRTVLVAATDPDTLAGTADHVVILHRDEHDGVSRVIASRSAAEVFDERRATVVQVRSPQAARLAAALESEGADLAPAGPGALQVRGLDRARIGEVAHGAGVCLHELTEIGHDDAVFGLRPLPRQKELLPGLNRAAPTWHSGVRLLADDIEETEVVEAAAEASVEAAEPATVGADAQATEQAGPASDARGPVAMEVDQKAQAADVKLKPGAISSWRTQGSVAGSRWSAVKGSQQQNSVGRQPGGAATGDAVPVGGPASNVPAAGVEQPAASASTSAASATSAPTDAAPAIAAPPTAPPIAADSAGATPATAESSAGASTSATPTAAGPAAAAAPTTASPAQPEPGELHRRTTFGLRRGRSRPEVPTSAATPVLLQPAVPFTVALPAPEPDAAADGMTPWRAVAARTSQQGQQQVSVAEAAPAEQEASA